MVSWSVSGERGDAGARQPRRRAPPALASAVGRGRVEVEVDHAAGRRAWRPGRGGRRRAPASARALRRRAGPASRYSRISSSRCSRSSSANSRKIRLPSESSKRSPYLLKNRCEPRSQRMPMHQRLAIVDARLRSCLGALREQAVGGALEEQERRPRLELGIAREQLAVAGLEPCRGDRLPPRPASGRRGGRARRG